MKPRITWIDVAKGIGIFAIVCGHALHEGSFRIWLYSFHVPLFFLLSGITFSAKDLAFKAFLEKAIKRILIPYFVFGLLGIAVFALLGSFAGSAIGVNVNTDIVSNLIGLIYGNGLVGLKFNLPLWFLPCLFIMQLMAFSVHKVLKRLPEKTKSITLIVIGVVAYVVGQILVSYYRFVALPWGIEIALTLFIFFVIGMLLKPCVFADSIPFCKKPLINVFILLVLIAISWYLAQANAVENHYVDYVISYYNNPLLFLLGAFAGISCTYQFSRMCHQSKTLRYIGINTMSILLIHKYPIVAAQSLVPFISGLLLKDNSVLVAILVSLAAILISLLLGEIILRFMPQILGVKDKRAAQAQLAKTVFARNTR